ncbi:hypothetical protein N0V88_005811 [Collariella sp. IMI 366227]|nr:hypothetical protein N0V88_005811 [Collariella sp. IMI 366227]
MSFTVKATIASFGGKLFKLTHPSTSTGTPMALNLFLPPSCFTPPSGGPSPPFKFQIKNPLLIYLSGLTCTPDNCTEKGFLQSRAAHHNLAILYPDTSPRGLNLPNESSSYDFGVAASFYLDATQPPWSEHYRMETYLTQELPQLLFGDAEFGKYLDRERVSITGHSMGGHGALTLYLRNPGMYQSVSAFAPIANPSKCPWGEKAFAGYLGGDREVWKGHDATELVKGWGGEGFEGVGGCWEGDGFYKEGQLLPENLEAAARRGRWRVEVRYQDGYDHSYFFIASFAKDHVDHAAKHLGLL